MQSITRRDFCVRSCQAASLAGAAALIQACGGSSTSPSSAPPLPTISASVVNSVITITVDASSPLANTGSAALVNTSSGPLLVARTGQSSFVALTAICTHQTCTIDGFNGSLYVCPCHGSEFNTSGGVVQGPAPASLRSFPTAFANNTLTITI